MLQKRAELVLNVVFVTDIIVLNAAWTNVSIPGSRINMHAVYSFFITSPILHSDITTWKEFFNNISSCPLWRGYTRDNTTCSIPLTCAPKPERWLPASAGLAVSDCSHWEHWELPPHSCRPCSPAGGGSICGASIRPWERCPDVASAPWVSKWERFVSTS
jgi:hypothetical protein